MADRSLKFTQSLSSEVRIHKKQNCYLLLTDNEETIFTDSKPIFSNGFAAKRLEPTRETAPNMLGAEQTSRTEFGITTSFSYARIDQYPMRISTMLPNLLNSNRTNLNSLYDSTTQTISV